MNKETGTMEMMIGGRHTTDKKSYKHRFKKGRTKTITKKHGSGGYPGAGSVDIKTTKVFQDGTRIKKKRKVKRKDDSVETPNKIYGKGGKRRKNYKY